MSNDDERRIADERDQAQRATFALSAALRTAMTRLAMYGVPWEDLAPVLTEAYHRPIDVRALLATDADLHARVWRYILEEVRSGDVEHAQMHFDRVECDRLLRELGVVDQVREAFLANVAGQS
jgi:hypothetical protein